MPDVTVLMPVYNGEKYLRQAIDSILAQTYRDFEFLILDDGSTDATASIIGNYHDKRIRFLSNPRRLKLAGALNRGLDEAQGGLIARMDADDIARPQRLARQVQFFRENSEVGVCGAWVERFGSGKRRVDKNPLTSAEIQAYALFDCPFSHPSVMLNKHLFTSIGLRYNGDFYPTEDYELWARAVHLFPCANIPEVLLDYRVHQGGMTGAEWSDMDAQGARIGEMNLKRLGIFPTAAEIALHRNIGRAGGWKWKNLKELEKAEGWLRKLWHANQKLQVYDSRVFVNVLNLIWFRVCFHATPLGLTVFTRCHNRPWQNHLSMSRAQSIIVLLAILKHKLIISGE
ncbi:MAG: glycosyltransferase [Desulfobulbaceae bacterium]|nr:glycosyltransferase [Desulfobulbaceae bacterium]